MTLGGLALGFIAIFLPPLAVLVRAGCGAYFLLSILLLFLGWIPAVLFAWFVIIEKPSMRQRRRMRKEVRQFERSRARSVGSPGRGVGYADGGGGERERSRTRTPSMTDWERRSWTSKGARSSRW